MAINPNTQYPGKIATPDVNYPYGGAQNIATPGDGTGTPWEAALLNDIFGLQQALLKSAAIVPSGSSDKVGASQYLQAIVEIASGRAYNHALSGTANSIILTANTNQEPPKSYFTGLKVRFVAGFTNTSSTVVINVAGLGVKNIRNEYTGINFAIGDIIAGNEYEAIYDGTFFMIKDSRLLNNLVSEVTVTGSSASSITVSGLDILADRSYRIEFEVHNQEITAPQYGLTINGSTILGQFTENIPAGEMIRATIDLSMLFARARGIATAGDGIGGVSLRSLESSVAIGNITSITIIPSVVLGDELPVGSTVRVYKNGIS